MDENLKHKITSGNKENIQPDLKMALSETQEYERQKRKREDSDHDEMQYLNLIRHIINDGALKSDRTGINIYIFLLNCLTSKRNFLNLKRTIVLIIIFIEPGEYVRKLYLIFFFFANNVRRC